MEAQHCRDGHDKSQAAAEILQGDLPPTPQRPPHIDDWLAKEGGRGRPGPEPPIPRGVPSLKELGDTLLENDEDLWKCEFCGKINSKQTNGDVCPWCEEA